MMSVATPISYVTAGSTAASFQQVRTSRLPLPDVLRS